MEDVSHENYQRGDEEKKDAQVQKGLMKKQGKEPIQEVVTVRTWKEYLGESILIIFSVVLALILTEIFNKIHDDRQNAEVLHQLKLELIDNKRLETEQYNYHLQVLKNIDSALYNPGYASGFIKNGEVDIPKILHTIAPAGVMVHDLNTVAWEVAKQKDAFGKLGVDTYGLLTDIYNNQQRITNAEDKIGAVLLSWESRKPENLRTTLELIRDNYHGWAVDRVKVLLQHYQQAIEKLSAY